MASKIVGSDDNSDISTAWASVLVVRVVRIIGVDDAMWCWAVKQSLVQNTAGANRANYM